jgi:hypothetical protein
VAAVAVLADVSIREAKAAVKESQREGATKDRAYPDEMRKALARFGVRVCRKVPCKSWSKVPGRALVAVNVQRHPKSKSTWHWVVFQPDAGGGVALDSRRESAARQRRTDLHRIRIAWYHSITEMAYR